MIDIPIDAPVQAAIHSGYQSFSESIADLSPVINIVRHTWSTQTLADLKEGKVAIPDDVVNESLAKYADANASVRDIQITSLGEGKLRLIAKTQKFGSIDFLCRIDQFTHNQDVSLLKFTVLEKDLPDQSVLSWIISRVSLSMVEKMVGRIDLGEQIKTKVTGDTVAIDFHQALAATDFGKANLFGYGLSDAISIESAVPKEGYIEFKTGLHLPETVKTMLYNILK